MPAIHVTFKSLAAHSQSPVLPINIRNNCEKNIYDQYTLLIISSTVPKGEDNENGKALLVSHARVCVCVWTNVQTLLANVSLGALKRYVRLRASV